MDFFFKWKKKKFKKFQKQKKVFAKFYKNVQNLIFQKIKKLPVQLELHLDPEIVPIFEAEILDNAWGQPQVQYGLARVLNRRQVGHAFLAILAICGFFNVVLTVFAFQK